MYFRVFRLESVRLSVSLTQHFKQKLNQNDTNHPILSTYEHDKNLSVLHENYSWHRTRQ